MTAPTPSRQRRAPDPVFFDVWGCRGSRNIVPERSRIGNRTSCYSVLRGDTLIVLDAGKGLVALGHATLTRARFRRARRVHVLVSHAHVDHWEGLKDCEWFWQRDNGVDVTVHGPAEALRSIAAGYAHPSYVPLEVLARGTLSKLTFSTLHPGRALAIDDEVTIEPFSLHHYSGTAEDRQHLDTLGYRVVVAGGPCVAYLCDHEPTSDTAATEARVLAGAHLAVYDAHFPDLKDQTFGHGSLEHAAGMARSHPGTIIIGGHVGARYADADVRATMRRHGRGLSNFQLAVEGDSYRFRPREARFERVEADD